MRRCTRRQHRRLPGRLVSSYSSDSRACISLLLRSPHIPCNLTFEHTCSNTVGSNAQYTPPTTTRQNSFVASASAVWTQFATSSRRLPTDSVDNLEIDQTDSMAFDYTNLIDIDYFNFFNSDVIMSSLLKKLSISIKIHVVKQPWSLFGQFPNCRPNPSAVVVS